MNKWLYRAFTPVVLASVVACGGSDNDKKSTPSSSGLSSSASSLATSSISDDASSVSSALSSAPAQENSSSVSSSSVQQSSSSSSKSPDIDDTTLTNYEISIDEPNFSASISKPSGMKSLSKVAWTSESFVFAVVDANGTILSITPASEMNVEIKNGVRITVPGKPRIDRVLLIGLGGDAPAVAVGDTLSSLTGVIYSPLTGVEVNVSGASTLAYSVFLDELAATGWGFGSDAVPVNQSAQLINLSNLIERIEGILEAEGLDSSNTLDEIFAEGKAHIERVVRNMVDNYNYLLDADTNTLAAEVNNGGVYWMEAHSAINVEVGGFTGIGQEFIKHFDGSEWNDNPKAYQEIILTTSGDWELVDESWEITALNEDGSIDLKDGEFSRFTENVKATQVISLSNRSMADFFFPEADAVAISTLVGTKTFSPGAKAFRADSVATTSYYSLWYNGGSDSGYCYDTTTKSSLGGNCVTVNGYIHNADLNLLQWTNAFTTLNSLKTPKVEGVSANIYVQLPGSNSNAMFAVKLVDDAEKTAEFVWIYHQTGAIHVDSVGNWSEMTLPNSTNKAITLVIPDIYVSAGLIDDDIQNMIFSEDNGFVRMGDFGLEGELIEQGMLIYNKTAYDDIVNALKK